MAKRASKGAEDARAALTAAIDDGYKRNALREIARDYGIAGLRRAVAALASRQLPETARAVRRWLRDDLVGFSISFQRLVGEWIEDGTFNDQAARGTRDFFLAWRDAAEVPAQDWHDRYGDSGCSCECRGSNDRLARRFIEIREAAAKLRSEPGSRALKRELQESKLTLVRSLWIAGIRKIDRIQLGQHALDSAKHEIEALEREMAHYQARIDRHAVQLERNRVKCGPRKGQPLTAERRELIVAEITGYEMRINAARGRRAHLARLLSSDAARVVREFTGCARQVTA